MMESLYESGRSVKTVNQFEKTTEATLVPTATMSAT